MVVRTLHRHLLDLARRHPVVTVTWPRQSGKTTLCRAAFPEKPSVSLEPPDEREFALRDPRAFLARFPDGAIIDELQRAPDLPSTSSRSLTPIRAPAASFSPVRGTSA